MLVLNCSRKFTGSVGNLVKCMYMLYSIFVKVNYLSELFRKNETFPQNFQICKLSHYRILVQCTLSQKFLQVNCGSIQSVDNKPLKTSNEVYNTDSLV